jgi:hypothetical protein
LGNTYTTGSITANCTVTATFTQNNHTVTPDAGTGGSLSPATPQTVAHGSSTSFTVSPSEGYAIDSVSGCSGSLSGNTYTTGAITANCTVTASFTLNNYTVTPSAGTGGSLSPDTEQTVAHGNNTSFTVSPSEGYAIDSITGCGGSLSGNTYTTGAITANCTVTATFTQNNYTVTPDAGTGGSLLPDTEQTVAHGNNTSFTVSPSEGYAIDNVSGCGGSLSGNTYTTGSITANCTVTATFTQNNYIVTPDAGTGGSLSPATPQTVAHGSSTSFTVSPSEGYAVDSVTGCGGSLSGNTYTTGAITANCTVTASFTLNNYTVTPSAGTGGSFSPDTPQTVAHGNNTSFTVSPSEGYAIDSVSGCGGSLSGNTYTTGAITADCTVTASFTLNSYTVTPSAGTGGSLSPETPQTVNHGNSTSFTVSTDLGYAIENISGCGGSLYDNTYTTDAIAEDCTVTATFVSIQACSQEPVQLNFGDYDSIKSEVSIESDGIVELGEGDRVIYTAPIIHFLPGFSAGMGSTMQAKAEAVSCFGAE